MRTTNRKSLWAGPYSGEFGFEIMTWQANIRRLGRGYDVTVGCKPTSRALYADFTDKFWDVPHGTSASENTSGCKRMDDGDRAIVRNFRGDMPSNANYIRPQIFFPSKGTFISYGNKRHGSAYDVVFHARYMMKGGDHRRSAPMEWWDELAGGIYGLSIACIGLKSCSLTLPMATDLRDIPLTETMDILASSRCIVGPSSGPIHLATLCGCPQVVWTDTTHVGGYDKKSNVHKLEQYWNPFGIPTRIHHTSEKDSDKKYWLPDLRWVQMNIHEMMAR